MITFISFRRQTQQKVFELRRQEKVTPTRLLQHMRHANKGDNNHQIYFKILSAMSLMQYQVQEPRSPSKSLLSWTYSVFWCHHVWLL